MQLIYMAPVPWDSFAQRPHKFVEWFHRHTGNEVLWIDPYPTRFPKFSDILRLGKETHRQRYANPQWLRVIKPTAFPIEPLPGSGFVNSLRWSRLLLDLEAFVERKETMLAFGKPSVLALAVLNRFSGCRSVYDAMDDFPAFYSGLSRSAMQSREKELGSQVTLLLVSSTALKRRWSGYRGDVRLVHNALDPDVLPPLRVNPANRDKRVFGYVGTIASWFDWEWLIALAESRPDDEVRLIGPLFAAASKSLPPNVKLLPPCQHQLALSAMQDFDVGLIPFKKTPLTESVDPIKYYEYRALGLPVLSTDFGEMVFRKGADGTFLSRGVADMGEQVSQALQHHTSAENVRVFAARNSWGARFSEAGII